MKYNSEFVASDTFRYRLIRYTMIIQYLVYFLSILTRSFAIFRLGVGSHVYRHIIVKDTRCKLVCSGDGRILLVCTVNL